MLKRKDGRSPQELRIISFESGFTALPLGSVLAKFGNTHVLCTVSVEESVPKFLADQQQGWLTAEYRMLPGATLPRQPREWQKLSGRTQEIQRLIGRSLRAALDLSVIPNFTLMVDADVLQADGGTRTTAITAGYVALRLAVQKMLEQGLIQQSPIVKAIAAVSVGLIDGIPHLDLDYSEDKLAGVDFNVVMDSDGQLVEVQGTGEAGTFSRAQLNSMLDLAEMGIKQILQRLA